MRKELLRCKRGSTRLFITLKIVPVILYTFLIYSKILYSYNKHNSSAYFYQSLIHLFNNEDGSDK